MDSNKHQKAEKNRDTKRKRQRSRSPSYTLEREKLDKEKQQQQQHKHHKRHRRNERKDCDSDVEIINIPPPPKTSKSSHPLTQPPPEILRSDSSLGRNSSSQLSLSIEETNKLRAKLGLKTLEVNDAKHQDTADTKIKDDFGEFYHKPAPNISEKIKSQMLKERLTVRTEKRRIEDVLAKVRTLGDTESDEDDDVKAWIDKTRKLQKEKKRAENRAKMLDQLSEEFGIGNLVEEDIRSSRSKAYSEKDLKGLKVEHDVDSLAEGKTVILTLEDHNVLDEEGDALINVNIRDDERYKRNVLNKTKKPGYDPYDDNNFDEFGHPKRVVLEKYDEEIQAEKKESFVLGSCDLAELKRRKLDAVKQRLQNKRLESLQLPELKLASDYYDKEEFAKFKKSKKRVRATRKRKLHADNLVIDSNDYLHGFGSRRSRKVEDKVDGDVLDIDDTKEVSVEMTSIKLEDDNEKQLQLKLALKKASHLRERHLSDIQNIVMTLKCEDDSTDENQSGNIVLNATAEFCRTLGNIPTYGLSVNRDESGQELMDFVADEIKEEPCTDDEEEDAHGALNTIHLNKSTSEPATQEASILDAEPSLGRGVAGALQLAMSKGYLEKEDNNRPSASRFAHSQAQNYSIEDKTYGDEDNFGRRDLFNGPISDFKEKDGFKPNVRLEYIDDNGHVLSAKEAFRYLSHKFHGKVAGKNKVEKRMKKVEQEVLMKCMSSTDTPLGMLNLLQAKQKETQSPYIVISGIKHMPTSI